jgi:ribosomal protein S25
MVDFNKMLKVSRSVDLHTEQLKRIFIENPQASTITLSDYVHKLPEDPSVLRGIIKKLAEYGNTAYFDS